MGVRELSFLAVVALAILHVLAGNLHHGSRPRWLSAAVGVSLAYVVVQLLPELAARQSAWLLERPQRAVGSFEAQLYLPALGGLLLALGLERATAGRGGGRTQRFWLHVGGTALFNAIIGGLVAEMTSPLAVALAMLAFGAYFLVTDSSLERRYGTTYRLGGRWVLASAVVFGWLLAAFSTSSATFTGELLAVLAGGIVVNAIKEELPAGGRASFPALLVGAFICSALLLALGVGAPPGD